MKPKHDQSAMKRTSRRWAIGAAIAIVCTIGTWLLGNVPFFQILNLKALDAQFVFRGGVPTSNISNIILLVADDKALNTFHEPQIFWHPYYAEAIKAAAGAGARVIGLDLAFGIPVEKWEPDHDRILAEAVSTAVLTSGVPVVCGYVESLNTNQAILPIQINMIAAAMGLSAFVNMTADPDDFVRRQELVSADVPPNRSFAMRVAEKYAGQDATFQNGRWMLQGHEIPTSPDRSIFINYAGPAGTFPRKSLADFIAAARAGESDRLRSWVNGKIVLIGTDTMVDRFNTPFFARFSGSRWNTTGVEVHANTVSTILDRRYLAYAPGWGRLAGLLLASVVTVFVVVGLAASQVAAALLVECFGILALTQILFRSGLILSASEILVAVTLSGIGTTVYRLATAESRGNLFRKAISLFVSHQLATALDQAHSIQLTGKRQEVTIMFSDIRGFTAFTEKTSEEAGPEVVVQVLNEYMKLMVAIIVAYGGQVNKFIGDGILAVFSDDDKGSTPGDHAVRAVRCAARMVMAPSRFETGVGIHTGLAVIGNVGSSDKMEYTVLGDTVNLASRLESLNKEYKTKLLMSEATQSLLGNQIPTAPIGAVAVRGKAVPISLYSVPTTLAVAQSASSVAANG
jgi:adenylate cyclase